MLLRAGAASMTRLRQRATMLLLLLLLVIQECAGQACTTTNHYDTSQGAGACDAIIASGTYGCDTSSVVQEATATTAAMYFYALCSLSCGVNYLDTGTSGLGACDSTIAGIANVDGTPGTPGVICPLAFAAGTQYEGAPVPAPAPAAASPHVHRACLHCFTG